MGGPQPGKAPIPAQEERPEAKTVGVYHGEIPLKRDLPRLFPLPIEMSDPQNVLKGCIRARKNDDLSFGRFIFSLVTLEICAINHIFMGIFGIAHRVFTRISSFRAPPARLARARAPSP
jgi:hypothetical protein